MYCKRFRPSCRGSLEFVFVHKSFMVTKNSGRFSDGGRKVDIESNEVTVARRAPRMIGNKTFSVSCFGWSAQGTFVIVLVKRILQPNMIFMMSESYAAQWIRQCVRNCIRFFANRCWEVFGFVGFGFRLTRFGIRIIE